jgi:hypothetical protein
MFLIERHSSATATNNKNNAEFALSEEKIANANTRGAQSKIDSESIHARGEQRTSITQHIDKNNRLF